MTIFLALSALLNIALGYGLAMYLGGARLPRLGGHSEELPMVDHAAHVEEEHYAAPAMEMPPLAAAPAVPAPVMPAEVAMQPAAQQPAAQQLVVQQPAAQQPVAQPLAEPVAAPALAAVAAAPAEPAELENEVLAGIEEFRNQLAQMKATPEAAEPIASKV